MFEFLGGDVGEFLTSALLPRELGGGGVYRIKIGNVAFGFEDWFEGWWDLFFEECVPVYAFEEGMGF